MIRVTEESSFKGAAKASDGNRIGDIGSAVQKLAESHRFGVVRELTGHGIGRSMHEDPSVPNYGLPGHGARLKNGMVIAIEPMITLGSYRVMEMEDGWTIKTIDGSACAHYEHTVAVTPQGPELLTFPGYRFPG